MKLVIAIVELETRFIRTQTCWMNASSSSDSLNADRGDLLVRGFWEKSTDTIIDVSVTNLDSKSYKNLSPKKALERQEKEKKKKYCKPCENQRRHFTPFVVSMDGMFEEAYKVACKRMGEALFSCNGFHQCSIEYRSS